MDLEGSGLSKQGGLGFSDFCFNSGLGYRVQRLRAKDLEGRGLGFNL